jgi:hypothetical protein
MLSPATRAVFERTEPMGIKHVSQSVPTYRYTVPDLVAGSAGHGFAPTV